MDQLKKIFFFKSSSNNGTDQQIHRKKDAGLSRSRTASSNRQQNHISSFRSSTPEKQCKKPEHIHKYKVHDVSTKVMDRYIDAEEYIEPSKQKLNSSRRLPSRLQRSGTTRLILKAYEHIRTQEDVYGETLDSNLDVFADLSLTDNNMKVGANDVDSELEKKYKEAEKRVKLLTQEHKEKNFLLDCDFDISSLVEDVRQVEEDRVSLAFEVLSLLRSQIEERASAREEIRRVKTNSDLHIKRLELDLDKRLSEWPLKLENSEQEKKRLRKRVRELAEHNVSLQREILTFNERETKLIDTIRHLDETVMELNARTEKMDEENLQNISKLEESYTESTRDLDSVRRDFEEKDVECRELHKTVTRFLRTCKEQEETIQGLRDSFSEEISKQPSDKYEEMIKKSQMEQMRLTEIEFKLRKELESTKLEIDSVRRENIGLVNRVKENEARDMAFKLDDEMKMRVSHLQDQGLTMLNESTELCYKFLNFIREKLDRSPNRLSELFMVESEMKVIAIRRGTERLKRSLETVTSLLFEKSNEMASVAYKNQSVEESLRAELRTETLITRLLKEKLHSKENEIEQLQAEVALGVRSNEVLQSEIQNVIDNISAHTHQYKDLKLQMVKKDEHINLLESKLEQAAKDLDYMEPILTQVLEEREVLWKEVKERRERNMDLETEKEMLKKKTEKMEEDILLKEGQITILKDAFENKKFGLLSSDQDFDLLSSDNDFLVT